MDHTRTRERPAHARFSSAGLASLVRPDPAFETQTRTWRLHRVNLIFIRLVITCASGRG